MNCPGHSRLFATTKRSYRDLPLRFAEFSRLHRNERSGTLNGLARVRSMAQDDGHIYCEPEQVDEEIDRFFELTAHVYDVLGLTGVEMAVSTRPESFLGDPADWDVAEKQLIRAVERAGFSCGQKLQLSGKSALSAKTMEFPLLTRSPFFPIDSIVHQDLYYGHISHKRQTACKSAIFLALLDD